ncbi:UDP-N-acetylmuramoyl-tripeptide--D-alanyl-D-alanine ligase [Neisseria sp.]|uniref:UDP-N-acetylmuramoyl-tripeptide--D-alanyl-D- alanine ligase n=1 Tax=Neisseria sp. TaxID=192066 RepID=UPI00359F9588
MKTLTLSFLCQALNLSVPSENGAAEIKRIVTDSRDIRAGDVFFALSGERFDAHDFVADVLEKGALAAVVSRDDCAALPRALKVADTLEALQTLAAAWRGETDPFVFGITGSSGKTTVKEMLAGILRRKFGEDAVLATAGNFNNHIGLPLTLLKLNGNHRYAVIEMGMNHFGELAALTRIAKPDAALVNNAQRAHVGCGFDGTADIAKAKSEIYQGLKQGGTAILPAEDANLAVFQTACNGLPQTGLTVQTFGADSGGVHAENIVLQPLSCAFDLVAGGKRAAVNLPVPGRHNAANACAAAALALAAGLNLQEISDGLSEFANIKGRLNVKRGIKGATLLDDTYNANPDSMKAALDVLAQLPAPRVFVMGDMGELGETEAAAMHAEVGAYARDKDIESAYFVGDDSAHAAEAFGANGLWFADKDPLLQVLAHDLPEGANVLVKGSRFMKMEEVVEALAEA